MNKNLIIIGAGNSGNSDLEKLKYTADVMCVGNAIQSYEGPIDIFAMWCVNGPMFNEAKDSREKEGLDCNFDCYSAFSTSGFNLLSLPSYGGGSGIYALHLAKYLGYEKVILVDFPIDDYCLSHRPGWDAIEDEFKDMVRSMSGYTKDLFGEPTDDWFINS